MDMGGNAIKDARRIPRSEYFELCEELQGLFPQLKMKAVRAFYQKKDFGDIDIVVENAGIDVPALVMERINPKTVYHNNMFFSFEFKGVQVDFISMSSDDFLPAWSYFCWNDLGNFIGRTARSINLKYGHDGLVYELRLGDHFKKSIIISRDTKKILEFLGYDYESWLEGFETEDEIFAYAAGSPLFNPAYFTLEDQSHNDRVRNSKRKMYQKMIAYIQEKGLEDRPKLTVEERDAHYQRAIEFFGPEFDAEVASATKEFEKSLEFKKYYNGDIVANATGLHGKKLGQFMAGLKSYIIRTYSFNSTPESMERDWNDFMDETIEAEGQNVLGLVYNTILYSFSYDRLSLEDEAIMLDKLSEDSRLYDTHSMSAGISQSLHDFDGQLYEVLYTFSTKRYVISKLTFKDRP
jgi:hypothetical protein